MSDSESNIYPQKPEDPSGFKKAVAWFGGRELIASLKGTIIYAIYGENIDPRSWMNANIYPNILEKVTNQKEIQLQEEIESQEQEDPQKKIKQILEIQDKTQTQIKLAITKKIQENQNIQEDISEKVKEEWAKNIADQWIWKKNHYNKWEEFSENKEFWKKLEPENKQVEEVWFDFIADSGDGQLGVYNVACLCLSDLWLDKNVTEETTDGETEKYQKINFEPPASPADPNVEILPRGSFLFVGGDTAYHASNYQTLFERFQTPFRWAFSDVRKYTEEKYELKDEFKEENLIAKNGKRKDELTFEQIINELPGSIPKKSETEDSAVSIFYDSEPLRPIFGIPGNHDYYDGIDGFNRLFRRPPFDKVEENQVLGKTQEKILLKMPTFSREQEASYIAVRLPFDWWMFGIDSENEKLDFRQKLYFKQIVDKHKPKKLIMATPEPTTVFGRKPDEKDKTAVYLQTLTEKMGLSQPFWTDGKFIPEKTVDEKPDLSGEFCRLDLSGDVHHYARYWGENTQGFYQGEPKNEILSSENYASVVAGGGGAFFDITGTLLGKPPDGLEAKNERSEKIRGEIPPQKIYPSEKRSVSKTADKIFDLINLRRGGYVQIAGFLIAIIIFYYLNYFSNASRINWRTNFPAYFNNFNENNLYIAGAFLLIAVMVAANAYFIRNLIKGLKERYSEGKLKESWDGRVLQIAVTYTFLVAGIILYLFLYGSDGEINTVCCPQTEDPIIKLDAFVQSFIIFLHLVIFLLLVWLSSEQTNWLNIRFKIFRKLKLKTWLQKYTDPNAEHDWLIAKWLGAFFRLYSFQYIVPNLLLIAAIVFLLVGFSFYGQADIAKTFADLLLIILAIGLFILVVIVLALKTGAAYHKSNLNIFWLLGIWHFILQIATPYILFRYGSVWFLLVNFLLVMLLNGSAILSYILNKLSFDEKIANFRIAAILTKKVNRFILLLIWFVYGACILLLPFYFKAENTVFEAVKELFKNPSSWAFFQWGNKFIEKTLGISIEMTSSEFDFYFMILVSILVVGLIGYVMSRVWLSWYLAVSMLFNGHNNEAGGAARIEGFKHILRTRIKNDELTVYVIGFDKANSEFDKLNLKLVDKFTLRPKPIK